MNVIDFKRLNEICRLLSTVKRTFSPSLFSLRFSEQFPEVQATSFTTMKQEFFSPLKYVLIVEHQSHCESCNFIAWIPDSLEMKTSQVTTQ